VAFAGIFLIFIISAGQAAQIRTDRATAQRRTFLQSKPKKADVESHSTQELFAKVRSLLPGKTQVPVRLPAYLPNLGDKDNPLFAILESADRQGYEIQLAWDEGCPGGNACHLGTIRASAKPLYEGAKGQPKIPITLHGGVKGYFINTTCDAYCYESIVGWQENGYYYSIGIKAESKAQMIKVANSAILGPR
jgi:hypothetical protein